MMNHFKNITSGKRAFLSLLKAGFLMMVFLLAGLSGFAQQTIPIVKGTVRNNEGEPLVGASVAVTGTKMFAATKKDGTFELKNDGDSFFPRRKTKPGFTFLDCTR